MVKPGPNVPAAAQLSPAEALAGLGDLVGIAHAQLGEMARHPEWDWNRRLNEHERALPGGEHYAFLLQKYPEQALPRMLYETVPLLCLLSARPPSVDTGRVDALLDHAANGLQDLLPYLPRQDLRARASDIPQLTERQRQTFRLRAVVGQTARDFSVSQMYARAAAASGPYAGPFVEPGDDIFSVGLRRDVLPAAARLQYRVQKLLDSAPTDLADGFKGLVEVLGDAVALRHIASAVQLEADLVGTAEHEGIATEALNAAAEVVDLLPDTDLLPREGRNLRAAILDADSDRCFATLKECQTFLHAKGLVVARCVAQPVTEVIEAIRGAAVSPAAPAQGPASQPASRTIMR